MVQKLLVVAVEALFNTTLSRPLVDKSQKDIWGFKGL